MITIFTYECNLKRTHGIKKYLNSGQKKKVFEWLGCKDYISRCIIMGID